jgi:2-polyprenyl-6-methoxyphenol hydroxylase-like FAD-dependent oxidoreductase
MGGSVETLVIGASAAGLATAAELRGRGRELEIVECMMPVRRTPVRARGGVT